MQFQGDLFFSAGHPIHRERGTRRNHAIKVFYGHRLIFATRYTFEAHYISAGTISYSLAGCLLVIKAYHNLGAPSRSHPPAEFPSKYKCFVCFRFALLCRQTTQTKIANISEKCLYSTHIVYSIPGTSLQTQHGELEILHPRGFWQPKPADSLIFNLALARTLEVLGIYYILPGLFNLFLIFASFISELISVYNGIGIVQLK